MQVLTPNGYVDASLMQPGDLVCTYDTYTGLPITNVVEKVEIERYGDAQVEDADGNLVPLPFYWVTINGTLKLFRNQSIWRNNNQVVHANQLEVGDIIFDQDDQDVVVTSVVEDLADHTEFVRFNISGDHSFTADGFILHNASRYWVGGGSTANWNATGSTNWGSSSGTRDNSSIPGSSDDVFFDNSANGNSASTLSAAISIKSLDMTSPSSYANTLTHNASVTLTCASGASNVVFKFSSNMTYTLGSATSSQLSFTGSGTVTITGNSNTAGDTTFNNALGTFIFADKFIVGSTATTTLTAGGLDFSAAGASSGFFASNNTNSRALTGGSISYDITGTGTGSFVSASTIAQMTVTSVTFDITSATSLLSTKTLDWGSSAGTAAKAANFTFSGGGTGTVTFTSGSLVKDLIFSSFAGTWTTALTLYGSLTVQSTMTTSANNTITFAATSGTSIITCNSKVLNRPITFNGAGGTFQLADACDLSPNSRSVSLANGTLDLNGQTLTCGSFSAGNSNIRGITSSAPSGKIKTVLTTASTVWSLAISTNATLSNVSNWSVEIGGNTTNVRTFAGGGLTYGDLIFSSTTAASVLNMSGSNTFSSISYTGGAAASIKPTAGTTTTFTGSRTCFPSGTSGNLLTWTSQTAATHTVSYTGSSPVVSAGYLSLSYSIASQANTFYAGTTSTDGGNNTDWIFTAPVFSSSVSNTGTGTDSTAAKQTFGSSVSDTGTGTDSISSLRVLPASVSDTGTGTDTVSALAIFGAAISSTATGTDALTATNTLTVSTSESGTSSDSITGGLGIFGIIFETSTGIDSVATVGTTIGRSISESATSTDTLTTTASFRGSISETGTGAASNAALVVFRSSISEASTGADSVASALVIARSVSETTTGTDAPAAKVTFASSVSEAGAGAATFIGGLVYPSAVTETGSISDSITASMVFVRAVSEAATSTDSIAAKAVFVSSFSGSTTGTDTTTAGLSFASSVSVLATAVDTPATSASFSVSASEVATITDTVLGAFLWNLVDDTQSASWTGVSTTQTPGWSNIDSSQTSTWSAVTNTQSPSWTTVNNTQSTTWTPVNTVN